MTVDSYTYCQPTDIQGLVGDIVPNRAFSGSTSPSLTDVEGTCNTIAAIIHAKLADEGYAILTNTVMLSTYPLVQGFLKSLNIFGACSLLMQAVPGMAIDPSDSEAPNSRANQFKKQFNDGLKSIDGQVIDLLGMQRLIRRTQRVTAVQNLDPVTGFHKEPLFWRGQNDIPGSRSLLRP